MPIHLPIKLVVKGVKAAKYAAASPEEQQRIKAKEAKKGELKNAEDELKRRHKREEGDLKRQERAMGDREFKRIEEEMKDRHKREEEDLKREYGS